MHPGACTTARVFVKGLTDDPAHADAPVAALFGSFGLRVTSMERLGPYKERVFYRSNGKRVRVRYGRRFAFLDVALPEDHVVAGKERDDDDDDDADEDGADGEQEGRVDVDASTVAFRNALQKAIRSLNGTTWKGATLRCQLAKERGDLRVLREIAEEAEAEGAGEGGGGEAGETSPRGTAVHEKENVNGENSVRFDDGEEEAGTEEGAGDDAAGWDARWAEIETPKQWVYNYERRLREVAAASNREGGGAGAGAGGGAGAGAGKSLVERFLEQEDEKRAKRREDREERAKESFGVVYEEGRKRAGGKRAREAPEAWEEARIAVVDFMTDDDDDDDDNDNDDDRGGNGGQGATRRPGGVDLSRFEDSSDSDEAMAIDANTDHDDHGRGDGAEEDDGEERDTTQSGDDSLGSGSDDDDDEGDAGRDEGDDDERDDDENDFDENDDDDDDERDDDENDDDTNDDNDENGRLEETLSKVFPNAAGFRAIVPPDQAQAQLNAQSDRIRTSLKTYRKKSRRLAAGVQK